MSAPGSEAKSFHTIEAVTNRIEGPCVAKVQNGGYRIIKQRLPAFHQEDHFGGMGFVDPALGFTAIARGLGLEAIRIDTANGLDVLPSVFRRP